MGDGGGLRVMGLDGACLEEWWWKLLLEQPGEAKNRLSGMRY